MTLVRTALEALCDEPVRLLVTINREGRSWTEPVPANAAVVDWVSYAQVMPLASAVVSSGGHGTIARALAEGRRSWSVPGAATWPRTASAWTGPERD